MRIKEIFQESISDTRERLERELEQQEIEWASRRRPRIDVRSIIDKDPHNLLRYVPVGVYLGYSNQSIVEFLKRVKSFHKGIEPKPINTPFDGTGFIPSKRERKLDPSKVVNQINKRRIYDIPFSIDASKEDETEWEFELMKIERLLKMDDKFKQRVLAVLRLVKKQFPEYRTMEI